MAVVGITDNPGAPSRFVSVVINPDETHPSGADAVQLQCAIQSFDSTPEAELFDTDTACDPNGQAFGQPGMTVNLTLRFTPDMWTKLKPYERSEVTIVMLQDFTAAISASNCEEFGRIRFGQLPTKTHYLRNENRTITLDLPVIGGELGVVDTPAGSFFTHPLGPSINPIP